MTSVFAVHRQARWSAALMALLGDVQGSMAAVGGSCWYSRNSYEVSVVTLGLFMK